MREAFERAAVKNPNPKITGMLRAAEYSKRRERRLEKLGGRFEYVGNLWRNRIMGNPIPISIRDLRREWEEELLPRLANTEESERPQLINKVADGLMLSENPNSSYKVISTRTILSPPLRELSDKRFSPASKYFFQIITDISGYSDKERTDFRDFMNKREDLVGLVRLPQVFPAVAQWLVQSRNDSQSSRLS